MQPIEQEFRIDRKRLLAYCDVCASFRPLIFLFLHSLLWFLLDHYTFGYGGLVSRRTFQIIFLLPCAYVLFRQIRLLLSARGTFRSVFFEDKAVSSTRGGKRRYATYRTIRSIRENGAFLRIAAPHFATILNKDGISPEETETVTEAIAAGCRKGRKRARKGRSILCAALSAAVIAFVVLNCFGWLPSAFYSFSFSETPEIAAYYRYSHIYGIDEFMQINMDSYASDKTGLVSITSPTGDSPTKHYYASRVCALWNYRFSSFTQGVWTIREVTPSLEFRTETASVCVVETDDFQVLEVRHDKGTDCRIETEKGRPTVTLGLSDGEFAYVTKWDYKDGFPQDLILFIDDASYPIGQMLAGN